MAIIYRLEKGSPLTTEEMDNNFRELHQRLEKLEYRQADTGVGWGGHIELQGDTLIFLSATDDILSQIKLPLPYFHPRGQWQSQQTYAAYDVVNTGKQAYCCLNAHKSSEQFSQDQHHWRLLLDLTI